MDVRIAMHHSTETNSAEYKRTGTRLVIALTDEPGVLMIGRSHCSTSVMTSNNADEVQNMEIIGYVGFQEMAAAISALIEADG